MRSYRHGIRILETQSSGNPSVGRESESGRPDDDLRHAAGQLPSTVCVGSNDAVWAELLAQNLTARGFSTVKCSLRNLEQQIPTLREDSWIVVDGGWPMLELQNSADDLNSGFPISEFRAGMTMKPRQTICL